MEDLDIKFTSLSENLLSKERISAIKKGIFDCEKMTAKDFMKMLVI